MRFGSSYYRNDVSGLGADDQALTFADQALIAIVGPQGSLTYTEWAFPTGDVNWTEVTPAKDYQAYAVSDFQLVAVANTTSSEVSTLAVISPVRTKDSVVQTAFEGTPFAFDHTEAIYAQLDTRSPPQIYFCYWLKIRDGSDPKIGPTSLNYAATSVLGVLSYIVQIPPGAGERLHPASGSFLSALQRQAAQGPLTIPATPAVQTTIPASPGVSPTAPVSTLPSAPTLPGTQVMQASAGASNLKALLLVGLGTGAAVLTYRYVQSRKRAS